MLIDIFKEMTSHLEDHCIMDDMSEIRVYVSYKIGEAKKRAADNLNLSNIEGTGEFVSVTLPSSKKEKNPTAQNIINVLNNYLDI